MKLCVALLLLCALATAWGQDQGAQQSADYAQPQTARQQEECPCSTTLQYDPVCGTDGVTYSNMQRLRCVQRCGRNVAVRFRGAC